ncbi:unnamed protein product, partial [Larinioides sclopetarius]
MLVFPRKLIKNFLLTLITIAVLFCLNDRLSEILTGISTLTGENHESTGQPSTQTSTVKRELVLLQMLGRLQHYAMGIHLQQRYKDFITTNPSEVDMINSNNYRCQFGAYCFIAGLYAPRKEFIFTDDIRWQPFISKRSSDLIRINDCHIKNPAVCSETIGLF